MPKNELRALVTSLARIKCIAPYPPALHSPIPPGHALTNLGSANSDIGLKVPVEKYGPTGPVITNKQARAGGFTPRVA